MSTPTRPRRSVLFMPGSNPRALEKARALPADGLTFYLEDPAAPEAAETARPAAAAVCPRGGGAPQAVALEQNALAAAGGWDGLAIGGALPIDAVLLPKVE